MEFSIRVFGCGAQAFRYRPQEVGYGSQPREVGYGARPSGDRPQMFGYGAQSFGDRIWSSAFWRSASSNSTINLSYLEIDLERLTIKLNLRKSAMELGLRKSVMKVLFLKIGFRVFDYGVWPSEYTSK